jgi:hypothetical protein
MGSRCIVARSKRTYAARLVRNVIALVGDSPEELKEMGEGASSATDEEGRKASQF